jgi:hypothetical protein
MNLFSTPLLALLMANRLGDSSGDAGRVALLAMMIRPPMMGLLIAMMVAKQKAIPKPVFSNSTGASTGLGSTIVNKVIPKTDHSFFPPFLDLTRKQATQLAKEHGLTAKFIDTGGSGGKEVVVRQDPTEGSSWPRHVTEVTLYLG